MYLVTCKFCKNFIAMYVNKNYIALNVLYQYMYESYYGEIHCERCLKQIGVSFFFLCENCLNPLKIKPYTIEKWIADVRKLSATKDLTNGCCTMEYDDRVLKTIYFSDSLNFDQQWFFDQVEKKDNISKLNKNPERIIINFDIEKLISIQTIPKKLLNKLIKKYNNSKIFDCPLISLYIKMLFNRKNIKSIKYK